LAKEALELTRLALGRLDEDSSDPMALALVSFDDQGDGVAFVRSSPSSNRGLLTQWDELLPLIGTRPLCPRYVLGGRGFEDGLSADRTDLALLLQLASKPWCHWIACVSEDRIVAKDPQRVFDFARLLRAEIYVTSCEMLPALCDVCQSSRGDVRTIATRAVCPECQERLTRNDLLAYLVEDGRRRDEISDRVREKRRLLGSSGLILALSAQPWFVTLGC
jgi:hypothetical protein